MPTVNFQCGHCHKLMGVDANYLGKQVRCPHCQKVVLAPAPANAATVTVPPQEIPRTPDLPIPKVPDENEHESIFGEVIDDDLFGRPVKPMLEMPPEPPSPPAPAPPPPMPNMQLEPTFFQVPAVQDPAINAPTQQAPVQPLPAGTDGLPPTMPAPLPSPATDGAFVPPTIDWQTQAGTNGPVAEEAPATDLPPVSVPRSPVSKRSDMWIIYFWVALVPYAIGMTVIAVILYFKQPVDRDPLERMPDVYEKRDVEKWKGGGRGKDKVRTMIHERVPPDYKLSAKQHVALGNTIRLADLEITPTRVEQKRVVIQARNRPFRPEQGEKDSLVLHVTLKNVSEEWCWYPNDPYFDRQWKQRDDPNGTSKPYTFLDLVDRKEWDSKRFYGGGFEWPQRLQAGEGPTFWYIQGQENHDKKLCPGEEMKTVFFTDPLDDVPEALSAYHGKLVWRLHLRGGVVPVKTRTGEEKLCSMTGVIGVEFTRDDIK
jgi:hypothetical protein